jgi:hypothetical protein
MGFLAQPPGYEKVGIKKMVFSSSFQEPFRHILFAFFSFLFFRRMCHKAVLERGDVHHRGHVLVPERLHGHLL